MIAAYRWLPVAVVSIILLARIRKDCQQLVSAYSVFMIALIAWYSAELAVFPEILQNYASQEIGFATLLIMTCLTSFVAGYYLRRTAVASVDRQVLLTSFDDPDRAWTLFLVLALIGSTPLLWIAEGNLFTIFEDAFLPRKRWSSVFQRARYGDIRDVVLELQMFLRASVIAGCSIIFAPGKRQSVKRRLCCMAVVGYCVARAFNDGSRLGVIEVMLPVLGAAYWRAPSNTKTRLLTLGLPVLAGVAFVWAVATSVGRDEGRFEWSMARKANYTGFEMSRELLFLTRNVPDNFPYEWGRTYYVQLINPIPRFVWSSKPKQDAGLRLAEMQGQLVGGEPTLTIAPGMIGEMYWNFGSSGVLLISMAIGWLCACWDQYGRDCADSLLGYLLFTSGLGIIFMTGRSVSVSNFYGAFALCITAIGLSLGKSNQPVPTDPTD